MYHQVWWCTPLIPALEKQKQWTLPSCWFLRQGFLWSSGYPGTCFVDQAGLELTEIHLTLPQWASRLCLKTITKIPTKESKTNNPPPKTLDGSVGKGVCHRCWEPEFYPRVDRQNWLPQTVVRFLTSTCFVTFSPEQIKEKWILLFRTGSVGGVHA